LIDNATLWQAKLETDPSSMTKLIPDTIHPTAEAFRSVALPNVVQKLTNGRCGR
jgi:hypothetical protein